MQVKAVVALISALFAAAAAEPTSEPTSEPTATPTTCEPISYEALDFPGSVCLWENKRDISADYTSPTRKEVYLVDTKAEKVSRRLRASRPPSNHLCAQVDEHPYWNLFPCQPSATRNCSICNASTGCLEGHQTTVADSGYFGDLSAAGSPSLTAACSDRANRSGIPRSGRRAKGCRVLRSILQRECASVRRLTVIRSPLPRHSSGTIVATTATSLKHTATGTVKIAERLTRGACACSGVLVTGRSFLCAIDVSPVLLPTALFLAVCTIAAVARRWVCSQALPSCNTVSNTTNITKPCIQVLQLPTDCFKMCTLYPPANLQ